MKGFKRDIPVYTRQIMIRVHSGTPLRYAGWSPKLTYK